jgi:hypothetical protein
MTRILPIKQATLVSSLVALEIVVEYLPDGSMERDRAREAMADLHQYFAALAQCGGLANARVVA